MFTYDDHCMVRNLRNRQQPSKPSGSTSEYLAFRNRLPIRGLALCDRLRIKEKPGRTKDRPSLGNQCRLKKMVNTKLGLLAEYF